MSRTQVEIVIAAFFLVAMALGGYAAGLHPVGVAAKPLSAEQRELTTTFCDFYYQWRETQYDHRGIAWADRNCFEAQEMKP